jgi:arylsulfatase A-like enzyme
VAQRSGEDLSDRRTFLKRGLLAAGSLTLAGAGAPPTAQARKPGVRRNARARRAPNILVILVDQMRAPAWLPATVALDTLLPNLASLQRRSVSFERHYTAANDCSPSRGVLLTGLYSHQTGCMITGRSKLNPGFPTWGRLLREIGYETTWWGKWHLNPRANASLAPYGFAGGTYPSPNGAPGQGTDVDGSIVDQFTEWFSEEAGHEPWCTTVSLVNPHDVAWWFRFTRELALESDPPAWANQLPPNFETPEQMHERGKPLLQRSLQDTAARSFGAVPFSGPEVVSTWSDLMNTYLLLQSYVDEQIGRVLATLASAPARVRENTVVLFTSDHGEYGGSHGMRGKGASAYEEAIRVPFYVSDPRGLATAAIGTPRYQLTSSADVVALLLTIATGSDEWRSEHSLAHIATRHDMAAICSNPAAAGRPWVLHATDEDVTEFANEAYAAEAPRHVIGMRTQQGKLAVYSNWQAGGIEIEASGQELELYDYSSDEGQAELTNVAGLSGLEEVLLATLEEEAIPDELRAELPRYLRSARQRGINDFLGVEEEEEEKLARAHFPQATEPTVEPD